MFIVIIVLLLVTLGSGPATAQSPVPLPPPPTAAPLPISPQRRAQFEEAMKAKNYIRAERLLVEAIKMNPKSAELLKLAGGVFFLGRDYLMSAVAFKKAEKIQPLDQRSEFTLAMAYIKIGHQDWARTVLERLAREHPKIALYPYWLARLDYDDQKFAAAVQKLNQALRLAPDFMKAHDNLGLCLEALGNYDRAIASYKEAIRLNRIQKPSSAWPPLNLGILLLKLGKRVEAEKYLRESLRYDPNFAEPHYRLGLALEREGKLPEAISAFTRAAGLDPTYPEPEYALARVYRRSGSMAKARIALREFQRRKRAKKKKKGTPVSPHESAGIRD